MNEKILIVDNDVATTSWLRGVLQRDGYTVENLTSGEEALARVAQESLDLVLMDLDVADVPGVALCRRLREGPHGQGLRLMIFTDRTSGSDIQAGLGAGADDYVLKRAGADVELLAKIKALLARPLTHLALDAAARASLSSYGRMISFFSPKGGTGTTTLAVNTAFALATQPAQPQVLAVDMVLPLGTVAQFVNAQSPYTVAALSHDARQRMDQMELARHFRTKGNLGFRVLSGANSMRESESLDVAHVPLVFDLLHQMFDFTIVDVGRSLSRVIKPVLQSSDLIVLIVTPDVNTVKLIKSLLQYLHELEITDRQLFVVYNRTLPRVWISKEEIEKQLGLPVAGNIPYDGEQMPLAMNEGVPYLARFPEATAAVTIRELVQKMLARLQAPQPSI